MRAICSRSLLCVCLVYAGATASAQSPLLVTSQSIAGGGPGTQVNPAEQTLTISAAGTYNVTLTDLQQPAPFAEVTLGITSGATLVSTATVTAGGAPAVAKINVAVGTYGVHVIGALSSGQLFGTAGVQLTNSAGTPVDGFPGPNNTMVPGFTATLSLLPPALPPGAALVDTTITISTADTYELDLTDLQFPVALGTLEVSLADPNGNVVSGFPVSAAGGAKSVQFVATTLGNYHLVGGAQAASGASGGLYNINVFSTTTQTNVFNQSGSVGQVVSVGAATLAAGTYQLALTDFAFPQSLTQGTAVAIQGESIVATAASGLSTPFAGVAGNCQLFALAIPNATVGTGAYGVALAIQGGASVFTSVQTASTGSGSAYAYSYPITLASGGGYNLTLADFQFPVAFSGLEVVAAQSGALLGTPLTAPGSTTISPAAGQVYVLVAATPGTGGQGLFGVELAPGAGGSAALEQTQGVGAAFATTTVTVATGGSYDVTLSDLAFPNSFTGLAAAVTQGATLVGKIFTIGTFSFSATPGKYVINVLGTPGSILSTAPQTAGTYGLTVAATPPPPTATLSASAAQVASGNTVTLTWSSQNATSCTATDGWNGTLAVSGTQTSSPITAQTTFTLTCTGSGGSTSQSVTVSVSAPGGGGGGGGSLDALALLLLAVCVALTTLRHMEMKASCMTRSIPFV